MVSETVAPYALSLTYRLPRLDVLRALVGHIPPHPLWAELLWQRQEDLSRKSPSATGPSRSTAQPSSPYAGSRSPYR